MTRARRLCIGAFAGAHGVKGEAKVKTFTTREEGVARYGAVESEDRTRRFTLKFIRVLKPGVALVSAPEITTREDAAALAGTRLYVGRAKLPAASDDEFYIEDLVGLSVVDDRGGDLGKVIAVHNFGAGDILELAGGEYRPPSVMIPFTLAAVPSVDIAQGRIVVAAAALEEIETETSADSDGGRDV